MLVTPQKIFTYTLVDPTPSNPPLGKTTPLPNLLPLHRHSHRIPPTQAQRRNPAMHVPPNHFVNQSDKHTRSAGANRMPQSHRASVHIDAVHIEPQFSDHAQGLHRECLVQFVETD